MLSKSSKRKIANIGSCIRCGMPISNSWLGSSTGRWFSKKPDKPLLRKFVRHSFGIVSFDVPLAAPWAAALHPPGFRHSIATIVKIN